MGDIGKTIYPRRIHERPPETEPRHEELPEPAGPEREDAPVAVPA